jgi:hypothetical protein
MLPKQHSHAGQEGALSYIVPWSFGDNSSRYPQSSRGNSLVSFRSAFTNCHKASTITRKLAQMKKRSTGFCSAGQSFYKAYKDYFLAIILRTLSWSKELNPSHPGILFPISSMFASCRNIISSFASTSYRHLGVIKCPRPLTPSHFPTTGKIGMSHIAWDRIITDPWVTYAASCLCTHHILYTIPDMTKSRSFLSRFDKTTHLLT